MKLPFIGKKTSVDPKPEPIVEPLENKERLMAEFLEIHPSVTGVVFPAINGKAQDILIFCAERAMPFSLYELMTEPFSPLGLPGATLREFMKFSGSTLLSPEDRERFLGYVEPRSMPWGNLPEGWDNL